MAPTARLGTGRSAEFADNGGGGGGGGVILVKQQAVTSTPFVTASAAFVVVPGSAITFTLTEAKVVQFIAQFPCFATFTLLNFFDFGIRINGVDTPVEKWRRGGSDNADVPVDFSHVVELTAGFYTVDIVVRTGGGTSSVNLPATADAPITLTALYAETVAAAIGLTKVEATSAGGGSFSTGSLTFVAVTGTTIAFSLTQPQTVLFSGFGTPILDGAFRAGTLIGIRIDGVDYPGTHDYSLGFGVGVLSGISAAKAIDLAAGAHTASLVVRRYGTVSVAGVETNTDTPAYLCAIYNGSVLSAEAGIVASAVFSGGNWSAGGAMADVVDGIGFVEVAYVVPVSGNYFFEVDGAAYYSATFPSEGGLSAGCSVDGADQGFLFETPYIYVTSSSSSARAPARYRMPLTLTAGPHTIRLRAVLVGGIPSAGFIKSVASPIVVALMKRP